MALPPPSASQCYQGLPRGPLASGGCQKVRMHAHNHAHARSSTMSNQTGHHEGESGERSVYVFESHLTPWEACINVNFANVRLAPDFIAACTRDHLTLLTLSTPRVPFAFILNRARELVQRLIDAHALFCALNAHLLEHDSTIWLEVKGVREGEAVAGYMHRSLGAGPLDPKHP